MQVMKQQLEPDMEQWTGSNLGKESPCLYADCIMGNARLYETGWIKIVGRNINNFNSTNGTTLMAESEEELKSLLKVKEEHEKAALKFNIRNKQKKTPRIMAASPTHHFMANKRKK